MRALCDYESPRYPTVASLRGAAGRLDKSLSWQEIQKIAQEDRFDTKYESLIMTLPFIDTDVIIRFLTGNDPAKQAQFYDAALIASMA